MNIYDNIKRLEQRISELETLIKEKHNASDNSIHNKDLLNGSDAKEGTSSPRGLSSSKLKKQVRRQIVVAGQEDPGKVSAKATTKDK